MKPISTSKRSRNMKGGFISRLVWKPRTKGLQRVFSFYSFALLAFSFDLIWCIVSTMMYRWSRFANGMRQTLAFGKHFRHFYTLFALPSKLFDHGQVLWLYHSEVTFLIERVVSFHPQEYRHFQTISHLSFKPKFGRNWGAGKSPNTWSFERPITAWFRKFGDPSISKVLVLTWLSVRPC